MIVTNETSAPLRVSLGGGKVLHLAPRGTANIPARAAERPSVQRMVERGEITIVSEAERPIESLDEPQASGTQPSRIQRKGLK